MFQNKYINIIIILFLMLVLKSCKKGGIFSKCDKTAYEYCYVPPCDDQWTYVESDGTIYGNDTIKAAFRISCHCCWITHLLIDFQNYSSTSYQTNWSFGDGDTSFDTHPSHHYTDTGTYAVTLSVENEFGLSDTVTYTFTFQEFQTLYFPNCFTPNGDDRNEYFLPWGYNVKEFSMSIIKTGKTHFSTNEYMSTSFPNYEYFGWSGKKKNGNDAGEGKYKVAFSFRAIDGSKIEECLTIWLIRDHSNYCKLYYDKENLVFGQQLNPIYGIVFPSDEQYLFNDECH